MICTVKWKHSFCALKIFQNQLYRGTLKYSILLRNLCVQPILYISRINVRCVENRVLFILMYSWIFLTPSKLYDKCIEN